MWDQLTCTLAFENVAWLPCKALDQIWENWASRQNTHYWLNHIKPAQHWVMGSATGFYVPPPPAHSLLSARRTRHGPSRRHRWIFITTALCTFSSGYCYPLTPLLPPCFSPLPPPEQPDSTERKQCSGKMSMSVYRGVTGFCITLLSLKHACTIFRCELSALFLNCRHIVAKELYINIHIFNY